MDLNPEGQSSSTVLHVQQIFRQNWRQFALPNGFSLFIIHLSFITHIYNLNTLLIIPNIWHLNHFWFNLKMPRLSDWWRRSTSWSGWSTSTRAPTTHSQLHRASTQTGDLFLKSFHSKSFQICLQWCWSCIYQVFLYYSASYWHFFSKPDVSISPSSQRCR